jgi:hypothetical protein
MSRDLLLLIGNVTAQQYQAIRFELLRSGIKPRIARVPLSILCVDREMLGVDGGFYIDQHELTRVTGVSVYEMDTEIEDENKLVHEILCNHLRFDPASRVARVVFSLNELGGVSSEECQQTECKLSLIIDVPLAFIQGV